MGNGTLGEFDWVNARADCSLLSVFLKLQSECQADVERVNKRLSLSDSREVKPHFCIEANEANNQFWAFGSSDPRSIVKFFLREDRIEVTTLSETLSVTLTLNNEGRCKLRVNGAQELDQWQLRNLVLADLFFTRPD